MRYLRWIVLPACLVLGSIEALQAQSAANFVAISPCRVVDTRMNSRGVLGSPALDANTQRDFPLQQSSCGLPSSAIAYALNVTVIPHGSLPYLTIWPTGQPLPSVSTLNSFSGSVVANAAIVPAGSNGSISVYAAGTTDVILDINGYFASPSTAVTDQLSQTLAQVNQQAAQQGAVLTQQTQQVSSLAQQISSLVQQVSQTSQQAQQVSQQAQQVNQLVSQVSQQGSLLTSNNGVMQIGTPGVQTKTFVAGITGVKVDVGEMVLVDQNGQLGTMQSSVRYKDNIRDLGRTSEKLYQLRPVAFEYKQPAANGQKPVQYGLIAEEVEKVYPELVVYNNKGQVETVQYQKMPSLLLNELQKQHKILVEQKADVVSEKQALQKANEQIQRDHELLQILLERLAALEAKTRSNP